MGLGEPQLESLWSSTYPNEIKEDMRMVLRYMVQEENRKNVWKNGCKSKDLWKQKYSLEVYSVFTFGCYSWSWSHQALQTKRKLGDKPDETLIQIQKTRRGNRRSAIVQKHQEWAWVCLGAGCAWACALGWVVLWAQNLFG